MHRTSTGAADHIHLPHPFAFLARPLMLHSLHPTSVILYMASSEPMLCPPISILKTIEFLFPAPSVLKTSMRPSQVDVHITPTHELIYPSHFLEFNTFVVISNRATVLFHLVKPTSYSPSIRKMLYRAEVQFHLCHLLAPSWANALHLITFRGFSGFTHTLERLWMTVRSQISLPFLVAFSRPPVKYISVCSDAIFSRSESRAASLDSQRHPTASNLSPHTWKIGCTIHVHRFFIHLLNLSHPRG